MKSTKEFSKIKSFFFWIFISFIILAYSLLWSLKFSSSLGIDINGYFFGASILNEDLTLYKDHFDHKGPFFYFYLKTLINIIGNNFTTQYFILSFTALIYFASLSFFSNLVLKNKINIILFVFLALASLYEIPTDAIIALFNQSLIVFGYAAGTYVYLKKNITDKNKFLLLLLANILFFLAILVRIDAIIHLLIFNILLIFFFKSYLRFLCFSIFFFLLIFSFFSIYFNYNFFDYYYSNIIFNFFYQSRQSNMYLFYRPELLKLFWITGYGFLFLTIFLNLSFKKIKIEFSSLLIVVQLLLSLVLLYLTKYDKNYFILIILPSIFMFTAYFFESVEFKNFKVFKFLLILYLIMICVWSLNFIPNVVKKSSYKILFLKTKKEQREFIHKMEPEIKHTFDFIKKNNIKDIYIVCSEASDNFYFDIKKPKVSLNGWLYTYPGFEHKYFLNHYNELMSKQSGFIFFINNICMSDGRPSSKYFKNLISNSSHVEHDGYFHVRSIK
tara:strand:+ start:598 stop:2097 length:1500 start_codon:yes stop_codon:yes gene_type:complete